MRLGLGLGIDRTQILEEVELVGAGEALTMTDGTALTQTDDTTTLDTTE
jgi:hypothetical protein